MMLHQTVIFLGTLVTLSSLRDVLDMLFVVPSPTTSGSSEADRLAVTRFLSALFLFVFTALKIGTHLALWTGRAGLVTVEVSDRLDLPASLTNLIVLAHAVASTQPPYQPPPAGHPPPID